MKVLVTVGSVVLEMAKGFARELGAEGARRLVATYAPPMPQQRMETYSDANGGYVTYEYVGMQGRAPVYRTTFSDDFVRNLRRFDHDMNELQDQLLREGLISPQQYQQLRRNRP